MPNTFANAAARLAYSVDPIYDVGMARGKTWKQIDTGKVYRAVRGGTGADCWEEMFDSVDLTKSIELSLYDFREVSSGGDVGAVAAIGGHLGSDTTPILRGDAAESQEISWATGNADIIAVAVSLPKFFSGTSDVTLELDVYSGSTDAATFTVETSWDGGAVVSDSADDAATKSATRHTITATIAAADVPDTAKHLTIMLTPAAHGTNATQLVGARLLYEELPVS